ncbi:MAG: hypothetical protein LH472_02135 [Pyrinomonadaceae bacterium]|nr:hypothetical protein [Pyrinomonadaceae bacterium]
MDKSWDKSVMKDAGKLTVYNGISVGKWSTVFGRTLESFNKNSKLTIKLVPSKDKDAANIEILLSSGSSSYTYDGTTYPVVFDATLAHGKTKTFDRGDGIEKAAVFLPSEPKENHVNVLRFIAVHELIHACGLDEHNNDGVFITAPNIKNGQIWAAQGSKKMPPLFFAPKTVMRLQELWK